MKYSAYLFGLLVLCCCQSNPSKEVGGTEKQLDNVFYVFNNGVRTLPNAPEGFVAQAELVKRLGYDGLAGHTEDNYFELRSAMDETGLEMPEMYIAMNITEGEIDYHPQLKSIMEDSKDRDLLVALHLHAGDYPERDEEGDALFVQGIRELADFVAPLGIDIGIYPHVNFYCETLDHAVGLVRQVDRGNVGAIYNLCHLLKVEGEEGWKEKAIAALPYLKMISINGAEIGDTQNMSWDELIQPLGEGTFDTYELVKTLKDNGYDGKFGLQCYNIKQDCETALTTSIQTWQSYQRRYREE